MLLSVAYVLSNFDHRNRGVFSATEEEKQIAPARQINIRVAGAPWGTLGTGDRIPGGFSISWPMQPWCHDFKMGPKPTWPYQRKWVDEDLNQDDSLHFWHASSELHFFFITKSMDLITARFACADSSQRALFKCLICSFLFKRMNHPINPIIFLL